jgi:hypothetical protein
VARKERSSDLETFALDALDQEDIVTPPRPADGSLYEAFHIDIMPTTMYLDGPFIEQSNRVIRAHDEHQDCFLRISFVDEARLQYRFDHEVDGRRSRIYQDSYWTTIIQRIQGSWA